MYVFSDRSFCDLCPFCCLYTFSVTVVRLLFFLVIGFMLCGCSNVLIKIKIGIDEDPSLDDTKIL